MNSKTSDLTNGKPFRLIFRFAVPMLLGLLFQQFYNMVDTIIVGKWLGVQALAAVGSVGSINFMVIGFCIGVCSGFAIPIAQRFGANDHTALRRFVANSVWISAIFAAVMTVIVCVLCRPILVWMRTPADIIDGAYSYIFVIFLGIPAVFLYNLLSGILRSLGDSRTPVVFLVLSSLLNIVLDLASIGILHMGVAGPALATVISQGVSGILCLFYMKKHFPILHLQKEEWRFDKKYIGTLFSMGVPMGLQYSITAIGSVILQTSVNMLGSSVVASVTAGSKVNMFFCCPFDALGGTMATFAGQNIGAKKPERILTGARAAIGLGAVYSVAATLVLCFFGKTVALLFMDAGEVEILDRVQQLLIANSLFYLPLLVLNVTRFGLQGMGYSSLAVFAGVTEMLARIIMGFGLVPVYGYAAVCFSNPLAWVMADCFLLPAFFICIRKKKKAFAGGGRPKIDGHSEQCAKAIH